MQRRTRRLVDEEAIERHQLGVHLGPDRQARLVAKPRQQGQPARQRYLVRADQRRRVGEQLQTRGIGQARPAREQGVEQRRGVAHPEEADIAGIDQQRPFATRELGGGRPLEQQQRSDRGGRHAAELQRHAPDAPARRRRRRRTGTAPCSSVTRRRPPSQRASTEISGKPGCVVQSRATSATGLPEVPANAAHRSAPVVLRIAMPGHVGADAAAERRLAEPGLEHAQEAGSLLVRDLVEGVVGFMDGAHGLLDGMRGGPRVEIHRLVAPQAGEQPEPPFGMEAVDRLDRHPFGERLVEPEVVPPGHGHEVAEPLMRRLVRDHAVGALLVPLGRRSGSTSSVVSV